MDFRGSPELGKSHRPVLLWKANASDAGLSISFCLTPLKRQHRLNSGIELDVAGELSFYPWPRIEAPTNFQKIARTRYGGDDVTAPLDRRRLSIFQASLVKAVDAFDPSHEAWIQRSFVASRGIHENFGR